MVLRRMQKENVGVRIVFLHDFPLFGVLPLTICVRKQCEDTRWSYSYLCARTRMAVHYYIITCIIYIIRCVQFWGRSDPCGHRVGNPSDLVLGVNRAFFMPVSEVLLSLHPKNQCKGTIFHTFSYGFLAWGINSPYLCTRNRDASNACPAWYAPWRKRLVWWNSDSPVAVIFEMIP